jgi:nitroreductase
MNSKLQPILARRSIRAYQQKDVTDDQIQAMLDAAMAAPSAAAKDPWEFIVVRDAEMRGRIADGLPNGKMLAKAPVGIIVCGDLHRAHDGQLSYMLQDCSAAIENLLLAAHMLGLGACWLGVHPREERITHIQSLLAIPGGTIPVAGIAIGWPAEQHSPRTRFRAEAVHQEKW